MYLTAKYINLERLATKGYALAASKYTGTVLKELGGEATAPVSGLLNGTAILGVGGGDKICSDIELGLKALEAKDFTLSASLLARAMGKAGGTFGTIARSLTSLSSAVGFEAPPLPLVNEIGMGTKLAKSYQLFTAYYNQRRFLTQLQKPFLVGKLHILREELQKGETSAELSLSKKGLPFAKKAISLIDRVKEGDQFAIEQANQALRSVVWHVEKKVFSANIKLGQMATNLAMAGLTLMAPEAAPLTCTVSLGSATVSFWKQTYDTLGLNALAMPAEIEVDSYFGAVQMMPMRQRLMPDVDSYFEALAQPLFITVDAELDSTDLHNLAGHYVYNEPMGYTLKGDQIVEGQSGTRVGTLTHYTEYRNGQTYLFFQAHSNDHVVVKLDIN